ncbi:zf-HC2 domain-containing protein [Streptomyces monticola]|uniref:Zf-HC2 domain-containing protein n=1 Tax=Streptomyces monticola TaxID=2666263 RepID=A0ABW2JVK2_9ACTN
MRALTRHRDAGAYALGVLDAPEAARFERHLGRCGRCAVTVTQFMPVIRVLGRLAGARRPPVRPTRSLQQP